MDLSVEITESIDNSLELNAKDYQSASDTIEMSINGYEAWDTFNRIAQSMIFLEEENCIGSDATEKKFLLHYKKENIEEAIKLITNIYFRYDISYKIDVNCLFVYIKLK